MDVARSFCSGGGGGQVAKMPSIKNKKRPSHIAKKGPITRKKLLKGHHMEEKKTHNEKKKSKTVPHKEKSSKKNLIR